MSRPVVALAASAVLLSALGGCGGGGKVASDAGTPDAGAPLAADWVLSLDPSQPLGALSPALLGQYDLSGELFHYDQVPRLAPLLHAAGFAEWRVGVGRWEFGTQLLPALTDGSACDLAGFPAEALAPAGSTDLDLIAARDWFAFGDGGTVTVATTADDGRYQLAYLRSVLDVVSAFDAAPYVDIDHMPRVLADNQLPERALSDWTDPCEASWTNHVSNVRPADALVFAAAVAGLVQRVVEGSGGEPGRPVRYWEFWNEPELAYAWAPSVGSFETYLQTAVATLGALDTYRAQTANADGQAIRIGLGSFADASTAATVVAQLVAPFDFISFHSYADDPLAIVSDIETVAAARQTSAAHAAAELVLSEWGPALTGSTLDPSTMDLALHDATTIALGAAAGLGRAHHALFWDFYGPNVPGLGFVANDVTPKPAYHAQVMLAAVIGAGAARLAPSGFADGRLEGGQGAVLASVDATGKVRVLIVNRNGTARTASLGVLPTSVELFDDPTLPPHAATPSEVFTVPARSLVLVEE